MKVDEERGGHFSLVVAPVLAAFTLPTIALIATDTSVPHSGDILSLLVASTGLLLASFQLAVGSLFRDTAGWGAARSGLAGAGLICLGAALLLLVWPWSGGVNLWRLYVGMAFLALGVLVPISMTIWLRMEKSWGWARDTQLWAVKNVQRIGGVGKASRNEAADRIQAEVQFLHEELDRIPCSDADLPDAAAQILSAAWDFSNANRPSAAAIGDLFSEKRTGEEDRQTVKAIYALALMQAYPSAENAERISSSIDSSSPSVRDQALEAAIPLLRLRGRSREQKDLYRKVHRELLAGGVIGKSEDHRRLARELLMAQPSNMQSSAA